MIHAPYDPLQLQRLKVRSGTSLYERGIIRVKFLCVIFLEALAYAFFPWSSADPSFGYTSAV